MRNRCGNRCGKVSQSNRERAHCDCQMKKRYFPEEMVLKFGRYNIVTRVLSTEFKFHLNEWMSV